MINATCLCTNVNYEYDSILMAVLMGISVVSLFVAIIAIVARCTVFGIDPMTAAVGLAVFLIVGVMPLPVQIACALPGAWTARAFPEKLHSCTVAHDLMFAWYWVTVGLSGALFFVAVQFYKRGRQSRIASVVGTVVSGLLLCVVVVPPVVRMSLDDDGVWMPEVFLTQSLAWLFWAAFFALFVLPCVLFCFINCCCCIPTRGGLIRPSAFIENTFRQDGVPPDVQQVLLE